MDQPDEDRHAAMPGQGSLAFELRLGSGIGDFAPAATGLHWAPRSGAGVTVDWRVLPRVSIYGGLSRTAFGCEKDFCAGHSVTFRSTGVEAGARYGAPLPGRPWARAGVVRHRLRTAWKVSGDLREDTSDASPGFEAGAGFTVPLGGWLALTPGIRWVRYDAHGSAGIQGPEPSLRDQVRMIVFGAGLRVGQITHRLYSG